VSFPSPANDYIERTLDFNELLIKKPHSTFFMRVRGNSMKNVGIVENDILIIDRSLKALSERIIVAIYEDEFIIRRLVEKKNQIILYPENNDYHPLYINPESDFEIWGVVTYVIHKSL
jgi:DNA polymerase V